MEKKERETRGRDRDERERDEKHTFRLDEVSCMTATGFPFDSLTKARISLGGRSKSEINPLFYQH